MARKKSLWQKIGNRNKLSLAALVVFLFVLPIAYFTSQQVTQTSSRASENDSVGVGICTSLNADYQEVLETPHFARVA